MAKLTNKQKIEIYERKLKGESTKELSIEFNVNIKTLTKEDKIKELENKILYLEAENEYLKKLNALVQEEELAKSKESE